MREPAANVQTILGAGGAVGVELARILYDFTSEVRLVGRNPSKVMPSDRLLRTDLLDPVQADAAVAGSAVAYLLAGLPYRAKLWREQWPRVMRNVLQACQKHGTRLVFFDNMYLYDPDRIGAMDERTPVHPVSEKGRVRAEVADMLLTAAAEGAVEALIVRSADFYGPGRRSTSLLTALVFDRLAARKQALWLLSGRHVHSFTFTPDAALGTAMLGNAENVAGQVWHLPTAADPLTGEEWVQAVAKALDVAPGLRVLSPLALTMLGIAVPELRELREIAYQYDRDYRFLCDKFNARFHFEPTPYVEGIAEVIAADYQLRAEDP